MRYQTQHAHYLTVSESRRWAMDNPVGNPYHDFKTKEMPIVPVVVMAVGAYGVATAATMYGMIAAGLTFASGAFSLAGQLTGNKTLSNIGMIAGVAGAAVGLAGSMGAFTSGADVAVDAASGVGVAADGSLTTAAQQAGVAGMDATAGAATNSTNLTLDVLDAGSTGLTGGGLGQTVAEAAIDAGSLGGVTQSSGQSLDTLLGASASQPVAAASPVADPTIMAADGTAAGATGRTLEVGGNAASASPVVDPSAPVDGTTIKLGGPGGSEEAISKGSSSISGPPKEEGMLSQAMNGAKKVGESLFDPKSQNGFASKLVDLGGNMMKSYGEKDLVSAQEDLARAQASGQQSQIELAQWNLELAKKRYANMNTRATSAAAQTGAINQNANIYSNPAQPAQGGLIFAGAK